MSDGQHSYALRGAPIPASMILRDEVRFCPLCLHEDDDAAGAAGFHRRGRLAWSLRIVTTCERHNLQLAPRLRPRGTDGLHSIRELVPESGDALIAIAGDLARRGASPLQSYVMGRLEGCRGPAWLDSQSIEQAIKATQTLGVVIAFGTTIKLGTVDADGWDMAGRIGWDWTSQGESGLHAAFERLQASAFERGQGGQNYATVFGRLYRWLLERGNRTDHGPIKAALRNYVLQNLDVCVGRELLGKQIKRRAKYSVQSLSQETGVHRQTLRKVLVEQGVVRDQDADKPNSIVLIDAEQGWAAAEALRNAVQFVQLPTMLNTTRPMVSSLIELDLIRPLYRGTGRDSGGFDRRAIDHLVERLHNLVPEISEIPSSWVTLTQSTKRARVMMKHVLMEIFTGQIRHVGRRVGESGFSAVRIDLDEVRRTKA